MCRVAAQIGSQSYGVDILFKKGKMSTVSVIHYEPCTVMVTELCQRGGIRQPACVVG